MLHNVDIARAILRERIQNLWRKPLIVANECVCDCNNSLWATTAFIQKLIVGLGMRLRILRDSFWMSISETINGLIFVSDNRYGTSLRQCIDQFLIRAIEVLVLIYEYVVKLRNVRMGRVLRDEIER